MTRKYSDIWYFLKLKNLKTNIYIKINLFSDAEYFLQATSAGQFMYLETIHEETSDDLRSENEVDSQESPMGWLASDSDYGSVICVDRTGTLVYFFNTCVIDVKLCRH